MDLLAPGEFEGNLMPAIEGALQKVPSPSEAAPALTIGFTANWHEHMSIDPGDMPGIPEDTGAIFVACEHTDYAIGKGIEALEHACAGLGQTVLDALYRAGERAIGLLDPPRLWGLIDWQHWYGMGGSAPARAEAAGTGADPEEMEGILTEETIYQTYPKWSFKPKPIHGFDTLRIPAWLQRARLKLSGVFKVGDVIKATQDLHRLVTCSRIENELHKLPQSSALYGPFWIMWEANDLATDIVDRQFQYESEMGETIGDLVYVKFLEWSDVMAARDALREIVSIGAIVKQMEELILMVGEQL